MIWMILLFILTVVVSNILSSGLGLIGRIVAGFVLVLIGVKLWAPAALAVVLGVAVGMIVGAVHT